MVEVLEVEWYLKTIIKRYMSVGIDFFIISLFQVLFSLNCLDSSGGQ